MIWQKIVCVLIGYVFGLFQTGFIIGKMKHIDLSLIHIYPSIDNSSVYNYETKKYTKIYDYDKLKSLDKYDIYLSGASSIIDIVNPTSNSNKELIVFRDSYGHG